MDSEVSNNQTNNRKAPKVLVSPLDWGLGHATRCIPIIQLLIEEGAEVFIAGEGDSMQLLAEEFPSVNQVYLKGYRIRFSNRWSVGSYLLLNLPRLIIRIINEHQELKKLIKTYGFNIVISDNRYGLWNQKAYSVLLTHQLNIIPPGSLKWASSLLHYFTRFFITKYNACWIPDIQESPGLSGELSHFHRIPANVKYVGIISRLARIRDIANDSEGNEYPLVAILSGPEPYRTQFEDILKKQLPLLGIKSLLIRGITGNQNSTEVNGNLNIINYVTSETLCQLYKKAEVVICRGGYSTLMDLSVTGNKVICVPTPGQTEQEYLAQLMADQGYAVNAPQQDLDIAKCFDMVKFTTGIPCFPDNRLSEVIKNLLSQS